LTDRGGISKSPREGVERGGEGRKKGRRNHMIPIKALPGRSKALFQSGPRLIREERFTQKGEKKLAAGISVSRGGQLPGRDS